MKTRIAAISAIAMAILLAMSIFLGDISASAAIALCSAVLLVSLGVVFYFVTGYCNRLRKLSFAIEEMAAGNFNRKIEGGKKDEIGQLENSIIELMGRLRTGVALDVSKHHGLRKAKMDFVAIASHQLRTPLSIVKWYVDYVMSGDAGSLNDEQKKYLNEIYASNERLIGLVNALLDASRIDVGTFSIEPSMASIIEKAEQALEKHVPEIVKKEIRVEKRFDEIPEMMIDPRLMKMVFDNLISNSVKYTPKGGKIRFTIRRTERNIYIQVSDTGCGIPKDAQPKIFSKLFRADNAKPLDTTGTGLGLYVCKAVIEKSGGKIWFESPSLDLFLEEENDTGRRPDPENLGTSFFITIPLSGMKRREGTKKLGEG